METLEGLRDRGFLLAVATGKSRVGLDRVLQSLGMANFFDATRCADETRSKPHPLMLQEILQELGVLPEAAVMVGDTEFDLMMARQAGVTAIGVTYGAHPLPRLVACEPLLLLDQLPELLVHYS